MFIISQELFIYEVIYGTFIVNVEFQSMGTSCNNLAVT